MRDPDRETYEVEQRIRIVDAQAAADQDQHAERPASNA